MGREILAALWSRPSSSTLDRPPEVNLQHLREALAAHQERIGSSGYTKAGIKGLFVAPEYYFARPESGSWDATTQRFRSRCLEEDAKETIVAGLLQISSAFPGIAIIPGSIAWRKPLERPFLKVFRRDKATGQRTSDLKSESRRDKNAQRVTSVGDFGMGGQARPSLLFIQCVCDMVMNNHLGLGDLHSSMQNGGLTYQQALHQIYDMHVQDPMLRDHVIALYGLDPGAVSVIPGAAQKASLVASAAYMMRNTAYLLFDGKIRFKYNKKGDFHESIGAASDTVFIPGDKLGLTEPIEGLTLGMEICLDHSLGLLNSGFPAGKGLPDIHVVISDHVPNFRANMRARHYFVHASTASGQTTVRDLEGGKDVSALPGKRSVGGGNIRYYKLALD